MSSTLDIVVSAQDRASSVLEGVGGAAERAAGVVDRNWGKASVALGAAGVALEAFNRKQQANTVTVRNFASATGMQEGEVRELAKSLSNATFPLDEVLGLMEIGRQRGLEGAEALGAYANFWDMVGDATGESSQTLAESAVVLKRLGIEAGNEAQALEAFGYVTRNTTSDVGGFLGMVERLAKELPAGAMPSINDMAAALGALEQQGIAGSRGQRELQAALRETDGDLQAALGTFGISTQVFDEQREAVARSGKVIAEQAENYASSRTAMQGLQSRLEDLQFRYGAIFQSASVLTPVLLAAGPAAKGAAFAFGHLGKAKTVAAVAARGLGVAMNFALGPIGLIIIAVTAAIAIGWLLYKNWDTVKEKVGEIWQGIQDFVGGALDWIVDKAKRWGPIILAILTGPIGVAVLLFVKHFDSIRDAVTGAVDWVRDRFDGLVSFFTGIPGRIAAAARGMWDGLWSAFRAVLNLVISGWNRLRFTTPRIDIPSWIPGLGGRTFGGWTLGVPQIPLLHQGGIFRAPTPGGEGLALLRDRERVTPPELGGGGQPVEVHIHLPSARIIRTDRELRDIVVEALREEGRQGGRRLAEAGLR